MSNFKKIFLVFIPIVLAIFLAGNAGAEPTASGETAVTAVKDQGFVADFYSSPGSEKKIGILALGGSEGGKPDMLAKLFAGAGYPVLCLAYFKVEGRPETLEEIELEYFDKAVDWMLGGTRCRAGGIAVVGASKGAELALLVASRRPEIKGVIAIAPSSVVWQGLPKRFWPPPPVRSSWKTGGQPLAFVPYDNSFIPDPNRLVELYRRSLANTEAVRAASIPVERINGPILLLSGADDALWPSGPMGDAIGARLKEKGFKHGFTHAVFPAAGHTLNENYMIGGTVEGNRKARIEAQAKALEFLASLEKGRAATGK
jgi:dienelactone hydrolase